MHHLICVKLCFASIIFNGCVNFINYYSKSTLLSWGRMMRAIRDNEEAANAMGKNVVKEHLLIFILRICCCWYSWSNDGYSRWIVLPWKL